MRLPTVPETFYWTPTPCGPVLKCRPLEAVADHAFTTRELRLSAAGDWSRVADLLGVAQVVTLNQVHGREVAALRRGSSRSPARQDADVLVSDDPDVAIAVRAADCVPLLLADSRTGAVGAVHAGWRGTAAGAVTAAVEALSEQFGSRPADVIVAIGPSIGACCYEVGTDLVDAFAAAGHPRYLIDRWFLAPPARRGSVRLATSGVEGPALSGGEGPGLGGGDRPTLRLDVAGANRDQLVLAGVPDAQIHACGLCTAMHLEVLTSYRAEKERAGRMGAVIRPRAG